jgi:hypothetical protein
MNNTILWSFNDLQNGNIVVKMTCDKEYILNSPDVLSAYEIYFGQCFLSATISESDTQKIFEFEAPKSKMLQFLNDTAETFNEQDKLKEMLGIYYTDKN